MLLFHFEKGKEYLSYNSEFSQIWPKFTKLHSGIEMINRGMLL